MSSDQEVTTFQHFNEQAQVLSGGNQRVLRSLNNTLNTKIQHTINGIAQEASTDLYDNKEQVKKVVKETVEDLDKTLKRKFTKSLLAIFSSLHENLRDNSDLSAFNFETWITNNINSLEENLGSQCVPSHKVLNLINDLSTTWTDKIEKIKASTPQKQEDSPFSEISKPVGNTTDDLNWVKDQAQGNKDFEEISETKSVKSSTGKVDLKTEGKSKSETGTSDTKGSGFMSRFKGLLKGGAQEAGAATKVNLGDDKNFKWDPIKKRYVFEGDEDVPEEEDQGPPPAMTKTAPKEETKETEKTPEEVKRLEAKNLMIPPSHRALSRKKEKGKAGPAGGAEPKKPAFMPAMFVPAAKTEETDITASHGGENKENHLNKIDQEDDDFVGKTASGEEVLRRIDEIFEQHKISQHKVMDSKKFKTIFEVVESVLGREMKLKLEKDMEVALLQRELDSTSETLTRESSQRKIAETELAILKERVERSAFNEQDLSIRLEDLEKEVEMYRDACSSKSEILSLVNESDYQEKIIEAHFKSLQDANEQKKKAMEARNEVRTLEMQLCEKDIEAKVWEERYKEIQRQNEEGKKLPQKLRNLIEEYMNTQNEQDGIIVRLKEENCEVLKQYRKAFEELGRMAEESVKTGEEVRQKKQEINRLQKNIQEKERDLENRNERIRAMENEIKVRGGRIDELEENLQQALDEKRDLEAKRQNETQDFETRIDELQTNIQDIHREKEELSHQKEDIINQRDQLYQEKERLLEEREQILAEKQRLENEKEQLESFKENLEKQNEELYRDKEELFEEKERIVAENNSLVTEKELISSQKESLEKFGQELTNKNLQLESTIQELETHIKGFKSEKLQWREALVSFVKELEQEETREEREQEKSELFAIVREYMEETVENCGETEVVLRLMGVLSKVRECVESKIKGLSAKAKLEKEEAHIRIENIQKEKLLMAEVEIVMKEEIKKLRETTQEQKEKLDQTFQDAETFRAQVQELHSRNEALETQLRSEQETWEHEKRRFDDLLAKEAKSMQDLEEKTHNVAALEHELNRRNEEFHQIQIDFEEQVKKLKEENEELQQQIEEGFTQYSFLQGKTKETIEQINQLNNENEVYRSELDILRGELESKNVLENQNIALREEIEGLNERINILSEELQVKDGHLHDLRSSGVDEEVNELRAKLQEAENRPRVEENATALAELEQRIRELEQENQHLQTENEQQRRNAAVVESTKAAQESDDGIDGDKLCASIERIYGDSLVFGYLKDFVDQMKTEKNVTTFKASLDLVGSFDEVLEKLKRDLDEKSAQVQMMTKVLESGGGAQVAAKVETPEVPKVDENNELVEQLRKEIEDRKQEIKELLTEIIRLRDELGEEEPKSPEDSKKKTEPTVKEMKKELKKEQDKYKKLFDENESNKKKVSYLDEERGAIQNSYAQIIRNLGQEIDDLKRKKGIPVATTSTKAIQTEDESPSKTAGQEPNSEGKPSSFFSGVAKWI